MWINETKTAIEQVAENYKRDEHLFLTESDLKSILSSELRNRLPGLMVNTESPWYDTYDTNSTYYIDITVYDKSKFRLVYDDKTRRKGYRYEEEAVALELKLFRYAQDIQEIANDFRKVKLLDNAPKNHCFIVAAARTKEIFEDSKLFLQNQMDLYRTEYSDRVQVFLFDQEQLIQIL